MWPARHVAVLHSPAPLSILVSVQRGCRSYAPLVAYRDFGVDLLRRDQSGRHVVPGRVTAKFDAVDWAWDAGVPVLEGVIAFRRCAHAAVFERADHAIVIGEVRQARVARGEPLCCLRRRMDGRIEPPR